MKRRIMNHPPCLIGLLQKYHAMLAARQMGAKKAKKSWRNILSFARINAPGFQSIISERSAGTPRQLNRGGADGQTFVCDIFCGSNGWDFFEGRTVFDRPAVGEWARPSGQVV